MPGFCTICSVRVASFAGLTECPNCSSRSMPCEDANQVKVSINWHEIRVLCIWAERWATEKACGVDTVYAIARRLHKQHEKMPPLTLNSELDDLQARGIDVRMKWPR